MRKKIDLPFGMVNGVAPGVGVLDGISVSQAEGEVLGAFSGPLVLMSFLSSFVRENVFDSCVKSL